MMTQVAGTVLVAFAVMAAGRTGVVAQSRAGSADAAAGIKVCALLSKDEVKAFVPWIPALDQMPIREEAIPPNGSSCNYPSVDIQVLPSTSRLLQIAKQGGGLEPLAGIGDEAYFHNNANRYAEVYVRTGRYIVTVQASGSGTIDALKPGAVGLAKALAAKLK
jgi:hypothetical protein